MNATLQRVSVRLRRRGRISVSTPTVTLAHGGGGKAMKDLIDDVFVRAFDNPPVTARRSAAALLRRSQATCDRLAFTTDGFVVDPLFFPGGDIGTLAVCGTVNDLAVGGAVPLYLSCAAIIEEGCPIELLRRVASNRWPSAAARSIAGCASSPATPKSSRTRRLRQALPDHRGGIGAIPRRNPPLGAHPRARPGDVVMVNGWLGDHGAAILAARGDLALDAPVESDCAPLNTLVAALLNAAPATRFMRDATRGGVATVLNEIAEASGVEIALDEAAMPLREDIRGFCEILGIDPLYLANEGKLVAIVPAAGPPTRRSRAMRAHPLGSNAACRDRPRHPPRRAARHDEDPLRRQPHRRHAGRRPATPDLLMHELSITRNIVAIVGEAAAGRRVSRVTLDIGRLSGVMDDAIRFCFPIVAEGTALSGAALDINLIDGRAKCGDCAAEFFADTLFTPCPCGSRDTVVYRLARAARGTRPASRAKSSW